jgi:hypothetical protein
MDSRRKKMERANSKQPIRCALVLLLLSVLYASQSGIMRSLPANANFNTDSASPSEELESPLQEENQKEALERIKSPQFVFTSASKSPESRFRQFALHGTH